MAFSSLLRHFCRQFRLLQKAFLCLLNFKGRLFQATALRVFSKKLSSKNAFSVATFTQPFTVFFPLLK